MQGKKIKEIFLVMAPNLLSLLDNSFEKVI